MLSLSKSTVRFKGARIARLDSQRAYEVLSSALVASWLKYDARSVSCAARSYNSRNTCVSRALEDVGQSFVLVTKYSAGCERV